MAMAQAESTSVSCSGPVRVVLIGHSYVRRLQEFCDQHPELHNLGFPGQDAIVRSFARGGATLRYSDNDRWVNCQLQPALRCRPAIVYLHIGENDILHLDVDVLVDQLWALVQYIRAVAHPRAIIISQLLWFPAYEDRQEQVSLVNYRLEKLIEQSHTVPGVPHTELHCLRHQYGVWGPNRWSLFAEDKVHLNSKALRNYGFCVRNAVGSHLRKLQG